MGEKFEEDPYIRNRKQSYRRQGIYLKVKELNVITKDHLYIWNYINWNWHQVKKISQIFRYKILATNKELAMRSVDFSFGERSINHSHGDNGSELTPEQVRGFSTPSKKQKFLKKVIAKNVGIRFVTCAPKQQMYPGLVVIMKARLVNNVIIGSMQHVWVSQKPRMKLSRT